MGNSNTLPDIISSNPPTPNVDTNDTEIPSNVDCAFDEMKNLKLKHPKNIFLGHLNINSIPNKFDGIMDFVNENLDIFLISETKIDGTFPGGQFHRQGFSTPFRRDRSLGAGGLLLYINENIPSLGKNDNSTPSDIENICVEVNLRKQKWLIIGIYRPPSMNTTYFFNHLSRITDFYSSKYDRIVLMGDFNAEPPD